MKPNVNPINSPLPKGDGKIYVPIIRKFWISHGVAFLWMLFSIYVSLPWLRDFANIIPFPVALLVITGICYVPGYMNAFLVISLLLDRQPPFKGEFPNLPITILIAARNEEDKIFNTLSYLARQDYHGKIKVIVINNCSTDSTVEEVQRANGELSLEIDILHEEKPGKFHALNAGLQHVNTEHVITLDADTLLHPSAIRYLVARMVSSPADVCAVAGSVLAKNSRQNILTRVQEWDYFLGIASIKRLQGLYQGTLVAQGAFSLYKTACVKEVGGWPDAIGEDIVLTWRFLERNWKVYYEPIAVSFTEVPTTLNLFIRQRSRWARGMIEGLAEIKPWQQPQIYTKYLTFVNLIMPFLDFTFTFFWLPGLVLALFGYYWIVGPMTLLVLPLTLLSYTILYFFQKKYVFKSLNLKVRKNKHGFILFVLFYQILMSPVSCYGYIQEFLKFKRRWK